MIYFLDAGALAINQSGLALRRFRANESDPTSPTQVFELRLRTRSFELKADQVNLRIHTIILHTHHQIARSVIMITFSTAWIRPYEESYNFSVLKSLRLRSYCIPGFVLPASRSFRLCLWSASLSRCRGCCLIFFFPGQLLWRHSRSIHSFLFSKRYPSPKECRRDFRSAKTRVFYECLKTLKYKGKTLPWSLHLCSLSKLTRR
jgi:hypothetical protein